MGSEAAATAPRPCGPASLLRADAHVRQNGIARRVPGAFVFGPPLGAGAAVLAPLRGKPHNRPPMRELRLGLAQLNPTVGDLDGNFKRIVGAIERARARGVEVLALPEMVVTGYPPEDLLLKPSFIERAIECTHALLPHTSGMTVVVGTVDRDVDLDR